jgi:hypothetical protein
VTVRRIPEQIVPGHRLGRHVRHDPRSLRFLVEPAAVPVSKTWKRDVPVFDQGDLGSCTGNAAVGVLGSDPFYATLPKDYVPNELRAVALYSVATSLDDFAGTYPPDDTGSSGLAVAQAAKAVGLISGYLHMTSVAACQNAITQGPFIVGSNWFQGFDNPTPSGRVVISGSIRGGHEYECIGYNAPTDTWECVNSWGPSWGAAGHFFMSSTTLAQLLANDGDATSFVPITQPAPVPTPTPDPGAAPFLGCDPTVAPHILAAAKRRSMTVTDYMNTHWRKWFSL